MFDLPDGVGGRFSVLSAVGLVPAALLGMDVKGAAGGGSGHGADDGGDQGVGQPGLPVRRGALHRGYGLRPAGLRDDAVLCASAGCVRLVQAALGGEPGQVGGQAGQARHSGPASGQRAWA